MKSSCEDEALDGDISLCMKIFSSPCGLCTVDCEKPLLKMGKWVSRGNRASPSNNRRAPGNLWF